MVKKILVNAQNMEETRVAVVNDKELIDFDSEVSSKKPIKGNIYLAKVVRIEPSLQAVFIDYGGDRNGFLPFSEIHPDYYRIPADDLKQAELEKEAEEAAAREAEQLTAESPDVPAASDADEGAFDPFAYPESVQSMPAAMPKKKGRPKKKAKASTPEGQSEEGVELADQTSSASASREQKNRIRQRKSRYRVQEVIFPKQILLVQAIKDKRGKKCAAFSTYLSLAGQYCVLMPNAGERTGGISKRIQEDGTRKRLKDIINGLEIPSKMSMIIRTAGQERTKTEIKRDYEYLMRIWDDIRARTLESNAPQLIHAEADILMRVVRDFYQKSVNEIVVDTQDAYKQIRAHMKKLSPSGARKVKLYKDDSVSLFNAYDVESQIVAMVSPRVELPSGGSLVIGQTEALVAIDVNSGRATRERTLDTTALKTNLEAAKEIARQLRLRDLSGLIVIDFIDMSDKHHIQQVEKFFQQELARDRARVQTAPISPFCLLEMSRQRLRSSVMEVYSEICPHCQGRGRVYSTGYFVTTALHVLEKTILNEELKTVRLLTPATIADALLNKYRRQLFELEQNHACTITVQIDPNLTDTDFIIDKGQGAPALFSLEKAEDDAEDEPDLGEKISPRRTHALPDAVPVSSTAPSDPAPARILPRKSTRSRTSRGRAKSQLRRQIASELTTLEEPDEVSKIMSYDLPKEEAVEAVLSVDLAADEPLVVNGGSPRGSQISPGSKRNGKYVTGVVASGMTAVLRSSEDSSSEWKTGEVRLLDVPIGGQNEKASRASKLSEGDSSAGRPRKGKGRRSTAERSRHAGKRLNPQTSPLRKNLSEKPSPQTSKEEEPLGKKTDGPEISTLAIGQPFGRGALIVGQTAKEEDPVHSIKEQIVNPNLWKSLLKKKERSENPEFGESSFSQAIKERLSGEDALSSGRNGKKGKRAWLNDFLSVHK